MTYLGFWKRGPRDEAEGARVEALRVVDVEGVYPSRYEWSLGRGCAPSPKKLFKFLNENGATSDAL